MILKLKTFSFQKWLLKFFSWRYNLHSCKFEVLVEVCLRARAIVVLNFRLSPPWCKGSLFTSSVYFAPSSHMISQISWFSAQMLWSQHAPGSHSATHNQHNDHVAGHFYTPSHVGDEDVLPWPAICVISNVMFHTGWVLISFNEMCMNKSTWELAKQIVPVTLIPALRHLWCYYYWQIIFFPDSHLCL